MQRKSFPSFQRGLTLIEGCIVLAIASILVGTAVPSFQDVKQKRTLHGIAAELAVDLQFARSESVARREGVRFSTQTVGGGSCVLIHTGAAADCQCQDGGAARCSNGASVVKSAFYPTSLGVTVHTNVTAIRYDPRNGMATPAGTVKIAAQSSGEINHVVNMLGRVRTCSPGATAAGVKPC